MQLGYIGFAVSKIDAWRQLCGKVIGLAEGGPNSDGSIGFRMDDRVQRLFVREGLADDVCTLRLCTADEREYHATLDRLSAHGVTGMAASAAVASARAVRRWVHIEGPCGVPLWQCIACASRNIPIVTTCLPGWRSNAVQVTAPVAALRARGAGSIVVNRYG